MTNRVNCWKPLRAMYTTAKLATVGATVQKVHGLGNQQPSSIKMFADGKGSTTRRVGTFPRVPGTDVKLKAHEVPSVKI